MTLRPLIALTALFVSPSALASSAAPTEPATEASAGTTAQTTRTTPTARKIERTRPGAPLKPRVIEAPGAALMMIPASFDPALDGPFSRF